MGVKRLLINPYLPPPLSRCLFISNRTKSIGTTSDLAMCFPEWVCVNAYKGSKRNSLLFGFDFGGNAQ